MDLVFIFPTESVVWEEMDGLGGLTRFRQQSVFRGSEAGTPELDDLAQGPSRARVGQPRVAVPKRTRSSNTEIAL
jgi:hypothetical protein